jgi:hypothetical protein
MPDRRRGTDRISDGAPGDGWPRRTHQYQSMIETLEEGLSVRYGHPARVASVHGREFGKSSSFPIHRLDVRLESGAVVPVIFKDLNPLRQLRNARHIRPLELGRSRREMFMYRHVLPQLALGTPDLCGHRWEPRRGEMWLFTEDVGPHRLGHRIDLDLYLKAVAWAGRFHAMTAGAAHDPRLLRFVVDHYRQQGRTLEACLNRIAEEDRPVIEKALTRYEKMIIVVNELPCGMIHGEYFGKNVLIRSSDPTSHPIAVIDWETAATGPQYVDLVSISTGRWTGSQRSIMRRVYFETRYARPDWSTRDDARWRDFNDQLDVVALLHAISWLGFWAGSDPDDAKYVSHVSRWVREVRICMGEDTSE